MKDKKYLRKPGSVLFIGTSYYNNEFLADELRKMGWRAQLVVSGYEGVGTFLHGSDKMVLNDCFNTVTEPFPSLFATLTPIMRCLGDSRTIGSNKGSATKSQWWIDFIRAENAELENAFSCSSSPYAPVIRKLLEISACCCAWQEEIRVRASSCPEDLHPLLEQSDNGRKMLREVFQKFLRALRPPHPELEIFDELVSGHFQIAHFTGVHSMRLLYWYGFQKFGSQPLFWDINILKKLGVKIVYSQVACFDGVKKSIFSSYLPPVCELCNWNDGVYCNDVINSRWGWIRNYLADYQIMLGGCRDDFNNTATAHETPEFYCLDENVWSPESAHQTPDPTKDIVLYHAVGNYDLRTRNKKNIKCTHVYSAIVDNLRKKGYNVRLDIVSGVPNREIARRQRQATIFCDQLTYGWYGANAREGMMLGKPVICFLRPEWLENVAREIPEFATELPIISATPDTVEAAIENLIQNPEKITAIGRHGREFALKWHGKKAGALRMVEIYNNILNS